MIENTTIATCTIGLFAQLSILYDIFMTHGVTYMLIMATLFGVIDIAIMVLVEFILDK